MPERETPIGFLTPPMPGDPRFPLWSGSLQHVDPIPVYVHADGSLRLSPSDRGSEHPGIWIEAHDSASCVECQAEATTKVKGSE